MPYNFSRSLFIDCANLEEVKKWNATGIIDGVTTNQFVFVRDGLRAKEVNKIIRSICTEMKDKPVCIELSDSNKSPENMLLEAKRLNAMAANIVVKVPIIPDTTKSLWIIKQLAKANIAVNATLIMTFEQMLMAILAVRLCKKTSFVSLFWGRTIEDHVKYRSRSDFMAQYPRVGMESPVNSEPKNIVTATSQFIKEGNYTNTKIIVGSIRTAAMVGESFAAGANIVTTTSEILNAMLFSKRTLETMEQFDEAWKKLQEAK